MNKEVSVFCQMIEWLYHNHEKPWEYGSSTARSIFNHINTQYVPFSTEKELESMLPDATGEADFLAQRKFLYLDPIDKGQIQVPVLSLRCELEDDTLRLRLGLFTKDESEEESKNVIRSIGYRFETPEGEGRHNFFHTQLIRAFAKDPRFNLLNCPTWLSDKEPTFPLAATDPVNLLVCLLVSLYGGEYLKVLGRTPFKNQLKKHLQDLTFHN